MRQARAAEKGIIHNLDEDLQPSHMRGTRGLRTPGFGDDDGPADLLELDPEAEGGEVQDVARVPRQGPATLPSTVAICDASGDGDDNAMLDLSGVDAE